MADALSERMKSLWSLIESSFKTGAKNTDLSKVITVDTRESETWVRLLGLGWAPGEGLRSPPSGAIQLARLWQAEMLLAPLREPSQEIADRVEVFGQEWAAGYANAILTALRPSLQLSAIPTEAALAKRALALGSPCRLLCGSLTYPTFEDLEIREIVSVEPSRDIGAECVLLMSSSHRGPWVEQLEKTVDLSWSFSRPEEVVVHAARRLYLNNPTACVLYG